MHTQFGPRTLVQLALTGAIALLVNLFIYYSLELVKPAPQYDTFCPTEVVQKQYSDEATCTAGGGHWQSTLGMPKDTTEPQGYCDATYTCQKAFDTASKDYSGIAFLVFVIAGVVLLGAGVFTPKGSSVVSNGLALAGLLAIFIGSAWHWDTMLVWVKVVLLAAGLVVLILIAWHKFKDE